MARKRHDGHAPGPGSPAPRAPTGDRSARGPAGDGEDGDAPERSLSEAAAQGDASIGAEEALLEELIYERVRLSVDLLELVEFERQLSEGIEGALASRGSARERRELARGYVERAWERLEREWARAREGPDALQCPLCGELSEAAF